MKLLIYKPVLILAAILIFSSCSKLTDVNNVEPVNQLSEDQAITTVSQAQSILYGAYGQVKTGLEVVAGVERLQRDLVDLTLLLSLIHISEPTRPY